MIVLHRVLIGVTGAIGKMGPQSQILTNKIGFEVGLQLGAQLLEDGKIDGSTSVEKMWDLVNSELGIDPKAEIVTGGGDGAIAEITIRDCHICPKKVGKYAIPGTACPVGGILHGVAHAADVLQRNLDLQLTPGEICKVVIRA
jgi:hypothetical protein